MSARVEQSQPIGGFRISDGSRRRPLLQRRGVIATFVASRPRSTAASGCARSKNPKMLRNLEPVIPGRPAGPARSKNTERGEWDAAHPPSVFMGSGPRARRADDASKDQGSRIASSTLRTTPFSTYMKTERVPTLMSAVRVMPGIRRKLSGTR